MFRLKNGALDMGLLAKAVLDRKRAFGLTLFVDNQNNRDL
jgi:hypothetical protein